MDVFVLIIILGCISLIFLYLLHLILTTVLTRKREELIEKIKEETKL